MAKVGVGPDYENKIHLAQLDFRIKAKVNNTVRRGLVCRGTFASITGVASK